MQKKILLKTVLAGILAMLTSQPGAYAQKTTATLAGIVTDKGSAILPGAQVELKNTLTGTVNTRRADASGEFIFDFIPDGTYSVTITLNGFKTQTVSGLQLGAAQSVRQTFSLETGSVSETVTVTSDPALLDTFDSVQRQTLDPIDVTELPSANRNVSSLLRIGAGVTETPQGSYVRLRLNGLGGAATNITANGTDASGNAGSKMISQYNGISRIDVTSSDAIGEVEVVKGVLPAEYGNAMGGNLNINTKSGTNALHGTAVYRYEGSTFDSKLVFLSTKPHAVFNQFGGSLGGPIVKDRLFFFGAYEGYRQRTSSAIFANVPTPLLRSTALASLPTQATQLYLSVFPLPNQAYGPTDLTGVWQGPGATILNDDHIDTRFDYRVFGGNLSEAFTTGHPYESLNAALPSPQAAQIWTTRSYRSSTVFAFAHGKLSSESRFGVNYNYLSRLGNFFNVVDPVTQATIAGTRGIPTFDVPGMTVPVNDIQTRGLVPTFTLEQQIGLQEGKNTLKFGGFIGRYGGGRTSFESSHFDYQTLADVQANNPLNVTVVPGSPKTNWWYYTVGAFAQDDFQATRNLVLNLGIRYDFFGRFQISSAQPGVTSVIANLGPLLDQNYNFGPAQPLDHPYNNDAGVNIGPRFGFSYNASQKAGTVIRGGFGVQFQALDSQLVEGGIAQQGVPQTVSFSRAAAAAKGYKYPIYTEDVIKSYLANPGASPVGRLANPNIQAPYALVYTLGMQQSLGHATVLDTEYVGTRGNKFTLVRTYNQVDRVTGIAPNPNLNQNPYFSSDQNTNYNALQTTLRRRLSHGFDFDLNYTWSKSLSTGGGDSANTFLGDAITPQEFFNVRANYGPSSGDVTNAFIGSIVYRMPQRISSHRYLNYAFGGWEASGIVSLLSGVPLTVTESSSYAGSRPDVINPQIAVNHGCCQATNRQYLNKAAFAALPIIAASGATSRPGTASNGQFRAKGFDGTDFSADKSFQVFDEKKSLQLRIDVLNVFNHTNYNSYNTNILSGSFGRATGALPAREVQLQGKFTF